MAVVYEVLCGKCNRSLPFDCALDKDEDLVVTVSPCEECVKNAKEETEQEVRSEHE